MTVERRPCEHGTGEDVTYRLDYDETGEPVDDGAGHPYWSGGGAADWTEPCYCPRTPDDYTAQEGQ